MLKNYLKIALRNLRKHPGYTFINVAGLAVGIACCLLILLYVQNEFSYDRFHESADRIVRIAVDNVDANGNVSQFARAGAPWGPALAQDFPEVAASVRFRFVGNVLFRRGGEQRYEAAGLYADPSVFEVFTLPFLSGNPETALATPGDLVLTETMAARYFGDDDPLGQTLNIEGTDVTVTGVIEDMPANSHFSFEYLRPFAVHAAQRPDWMERWGMYNYHTYLLLRDEAAVAGLQEKLPAFLDRHLDEAGPVAVVQPLTSIHLHSHRSREFQANGSTSTVYILSAIALFILLIACINFMNLATARSASRAKEVGLRKVVGAYRRQLIGQFLSEAMLVSFLALLAALALVELCLPGFNALTGKTLTTNYADASGYLLMLALLGVVVGGLAGGYPAFFLSAFRPASVLKGDLPRGTRAARLRKSLVVIQFTISIVLLIGVGVVYEQLTFIQNKPLGFDKEQVVMIPMRDRQVTQNYAVMKEAFLQDPNVLNVAASSGALGGGDWGISVRPEGTGDDAELSTRMLNIDYDFLATMDMELTAGRAFSEAFPSDADDAFLINETLARQLGWDDPVGRRLEIPDWRSGTIVGVVKDFNFRSLHETIDPMLMFIVEGNFQLFSARIRPDNVGPTLAHLRETWSRFAPERPFVYSFLDESFARQYEADAQFGKVFGYFALLAVVIACLGLFGLASFTAERRTKEIGVRKVLGASIASIVLLLSKDFTRLVLIALVLAAPLAYLAMTRWLEAFAYRVEISWPIFLMAGLIALLIALLTVSYQAARAALADPVKALRYE